MSSVELTIRSDQTVAKVSGDTQRLFGLSETQAGEQPGFLKERLHPADATVLAHILSAPEDNRTTIGRDIRVRHQDGQFRILDVAVMGDEDPRRVRLTDVREIPHELSGLFSPLIQVMMETTDDFIFFKDAHHVLLTASQSMVALCEPIRHWREFNGKLDYAIFPEHLADEYFELERRVYAGEAVAREIQPMLRTDGTPGWVDNRKYPIRDGEGRIIGLYGIARDITDQIDATNALRLQGQVFEQTREGIVVVDPDGQVINANQVFARVSNTTVAEIVGKSLKSVRHASDGGKAFDARWQILVREGDWQEELQTVGPDGSERVELARYSAVRDDNGEVVSYVGVYADITDFKRAEELRLRSERLSLLGQMTAGVAHELNNPLMGILNYAQYCQTQASPEDPCFEILGDIERETLRCASIIKDLLAFSRSRPQSDTPSQLVDVREVIRQVTNLLGYRLDGSGIAIDLSVPEGQHSLPLGRDELEVIVINLLSNAIDALADVDSPALSIRFLSESSQQLLEVTDTGTGISADQQAHIFEPFFTTKPAGKGTGLGLSNVWSIVQQCNGEIHCESREGVGTTIRIRLPLVAAVGES